eukprot:4859807-Amphidinium_carterae.1
METLNVPGSPQVDHAGAVPERPCGQVLQDRRAWGRDSLDQSVAQDVTFAPAGVRGRRPKLRAVRTFLFHVLVGCSGDTA